MNYSYVMGVDNSILSLEDNDFVIEKDGDNFMVSFPKDKSYIWEEFVSNHLQLGYWNEYIEDGAVIFFIPFG